MEIRLIEAQETDTLKAALTLVRNVFWDLVAPDYDGDGIWAFDNYIEYDSIQAQMAESELLMWGYFNKDDRLIGVMAARPPSHISLFYVDKRAHRKGVGRQIFDVVKIFFLNHTNCYDITVNSSPFAVEVYRHLGFEATGPEAVEEGIRYTPMAYPLRERPAPPPKPKAPPAEKPKPAPAETAEAKPAAKPAAKPRPKPKPPAGAPGVKKPPTSFS